MSFDPIKFMEEHDDFSALRNTIRQIASERGDWAGIPMPLDGQPLTVEKSYPCAEEIMRLFGEKEKEDDGVKHRNTFWSHRYRKEAFVCEKDEKIWAEFLNVNSLSNQLATMNCSKAWGIEQESNAIFLLGELISHHKFKQYMLTGAFMETSPRSNITYMFRRLKPTLAISTATGFGKALCALCMHPIGYYNGTAAGAMCPTDDIIAHLMLMRGDEKMYWRRCNQHPVYKPQAML